MRIFISVCLILFIGNIYSQNFKMQKKNEIWDNQPALNRGNDANIIKAEGYPYDENWETKSYPIGNGYMGANIFERIQITDKTLYNKGLYAMGGLTNFVEIYLDINHKNPQNYRRALRINEAIADVNYIHNGVDYIDLLPAIPKEWPKREFTGLVVRGNFEISIKWNNGKPNFVKIFSKSRGVCSIKLSKIKNFQLIDNTGKPVSYKKDSFNIIHFETKKGMDFF